MVPLMPGLVTCQAETLEHPQERRTRVSVWEKKMAVDIFVEDHLNIKQFELKHMEIC